MHTAKLLEGHVTGVASETGGASRPSSSFEIALTQLNEHQ